MTRTVVLLTFSLIAACADAGEITGRAFDLGGVPIPNVTVQVLNEYGRRVASGRFTQGNYKLPISNDAVPNSSQGVTVIFSSPGRETVQVNLHARSNNSFNIVMPVRAEATRFVEGEPCVPYNCRPRRIIIRHCEPRYYSVHPPYCSW
jgi:hypothetical protein